MRPSFSAPASMRPCGSRNVTPVPDASIGYAFGSAQSSWATFDATLGISAAAMAADTSSRPAVPWSLTVATTPASSIVADAPDGLVHVGTVVARVDLDAGAVGPAPLVERLGGHLERGRPGPPGTPPATGRRSSARSPACPSPRRRGRRPRGRTPRSRAPRPTRRCRRRCRRSHRSRSCCRRSTRRPAGPASPEREHADKRFRHPGDTPVAGKIDREGTLDGRLPHVDRE